MQPGPIQNNQSLKELDRFWLNLAQNILWKAIIASSLGPAHQEYNLYSRAPWD
jgi:hypothetical protein